MNADMIWSAVLCVLAICVASNHSRKALLSTIVLFMGFLFYCTAWAPDGYSPRDIVNTVFGVKIQSAVFWLIGDIIVMITIAMIAIDRLWAIGVILLFMIQIVLHVLKVHHSIDRGFYQFLLDRIFNGQILIFFLIGYGPTKSVCKQWLNRIQSKIYRMVERMA